MVIVTNWLHLAFLALMLAIASPAIAGSEATYVGQIGDVPANKQASYNALRGAAAQKFLNTWGYVGLCRKFNERAVGQPQVYRELPYPPEDFDEGLLDKTSLKETNDCVLGMLAYRMAK